MILRRDSLQVEVFLIKTPKPNPIFVKICFRIAAHRERVEGWRNDESLTNLEDLQAPYTPYLKFFSFLFLGSSADFANQLTHCLTVPLSLFVPLPADPSFHCSDFLCGVCITIPPQLIHAVILWNSS